MGRPKIGEPLMVRLPASLRAALDIEAAVLDIPVAELVRRVLEAHVARERQQ